ncbi:MAG: hypothetical protein IVW54_02830 [Candidatus Binataceae bacterium]|nr:hypothetical protein [Candidatus Binataceae bacterium]
MGAINADGDPVKTTDRRAVAWCAVGALERIAGSDNDTFEGGLKYLIKASMQLFRCDPADINDRTNHDGLVQMYTRAIQLASRERERTGSRHTNHTSQRRTGADRTPTQLHVVANQHNAFSPA